MLHVEDNNKLKVFTQAFTNGILNRDPLMASKIYGSMIWIDNTLMLVIDKEAKYVAQYSSFDEVKKAFCAFLKHDDSHKSMFFWTQA